MTARKDPGVDLSKPVTLTISISGADVAEVLYGLYDVQDYLRGGKTSGEVNARRGQLDSYEFKVVQR